MHALTCRHPCCPRLQVQKQMDKDLESIIHKGSFFMKKPTEEAPPSAAWGEPRINRGKPSNDKFGVKLGEEWP